MAASGGRELPLSRVLLTTTGLEVDERNRLRSTAEAMGAQVIPHLTQECTHLIARDYGSQKANVAVSLPIPVVAPGWIDACFDKFRGQGAAFDALALAEGFRLPIFLNCVICVTSIDSGA